MKFNSTHRDIVLMSIANAHGFRWHNNILEDCSSYRIISKCPIEIARLLLPGYAGKHSELTVENILEYVYTKYKGSNRKIEALVGQAAEILAEEYGLGIPLPEGPIVNETNDSDEYFLATLRDRIMDSGGGIIMEKFIVESKRAGRIPHIEDLILDDGPKGLGYAIEILRSFAEGKGQQNTTVKWDGSPAIIFGRDDNGQFILTDKSGFSAKGYDGRAKSARELGKMFSNRKPAMDESRKQFVKSMMSIFNDYQKATPKDFRGFLMGDLMYSSRPSLQEGAGYVFQPNVVQYTVSESSKFGKRIGQSKTAVVVHKYQGNQYSTVEEAINQMQGSDVFAIPPVHVQQPSNINTNPVGKLEAFAKKHADEIKELFNPNGLKGIANIHALFYKYINSKVDTGMEDLGSDFADWLNTEKLTNKKRKNVLKYLENNKSGVTALWKVITGIMKLKDYLVHEFDAQQSSVQQSVEGKSGGEGYVVKHPHGDVKLVSRNSFTPANRAAHK